MEIIFELCSGVHVGKFILDRFGRIIGVFALFQCLYQNRIPGEHLHFGHGFVNLVYRLVIKIVYHGFNVRAAVCLRIEQVVFQTV